MELPILAAFNFYGQWGIGWQGIAILAVMTAVIINATFMMIGRAFSIKELETFARSEILQAVATAFMAIFLVTMVESAMDISREFIHGDLTCGGESIHIGSSSESTMNEAYSAIRCRLQHRASDVAAIQDEVTSGADTYFKYFGLNLVVTLFGLQVFKGDWVEALYESVEQDRITNNLATVLLIGLNAQSALLEYLRMNMLHVFIPVGILLRSLYFTRSVGALFISLGIGMYFLFPIFFVLLDPGFTASPLPATLDVPIPQPYCYATMSSTVSVMKSLETAGVGSTSSLAVAGVKENLSKSYVTLMLHPLIALFLTLTFVKYMMTILGGDTYELTKMVSKVI
ncbi:MAG: hypothetical protein ABH983_00950 [Candidatus Micrarchaeota archaeon]